MPEPTRRLSPKATRPRSSGGAPGKGDADRVSDLDRFRGNYDEIDWDGASPSLDPDPFMEPVPAKTPGPNPRGRFDAFERWWANPASRKLWFNPIPPSEAWTKLTVTEIEKFARRAFEAGRRSR